MGSTAPLSEWPVSADVAIPVPCWETCGQQSAGSTDPRTALSYATAGWLRLAQSFRLLPLGRTAAPLPSAPKGVGPSIRLGAIADKTRVRPKKESNPLRHRSLQTPKKTLCRQDLAEKACRCTPKAFGIAGLVSAGTIFVYPNTVLARLLLRGC